MLRFISFGSGSCGNCYLLSNDTDSIMIDAGIGIRRVKRYLRDYGVPQNNIRAILVTHDHADHIKGVGHLSNDMNIPVYTTQRIHEGIKSNYHTTKKIVPENIRTLEKEQQFSVASFNITAFEIPHDATENMAYEIETGGKTFTVATDIGSVTANVKRLISESDYLVIEANYDPEMLQGGPYPQILKERIRSGHGHISNTQIAAALADNRGERLRHIWLCHLSEENNHPELARKTVEASLTSSGATVGEDITLDVLRRKIPTGPFILED